MTVEERKDNTYYDQTGKQILVGDLLKVFHFRTGKRNYYMYHVAVMEETEDFPVMSVSAHWTTKPHCRLYVLCDNENRLYKDAKIIGERDWQTKRKRIKGANYVDSCHKINIRQTIKARASGFFYACQKNFLYFNLSF